VVYRGRACSSLRYVLATSDLASSPSSPRLLRPSANPGGRGDGRQCMAGSLFTCMRAHGPALLRPPMMADPMDHGCPRTARVLRHICRGRAVLPPRKPACPAVHATGTGSVATGTGTALTLPLKHLSPGLLACLEEMDPLDRVRVTMRNASMPQYCTVFRSWEGSGPQLR